MSLFAERLRAHVAATRGIVTPEPLLAPIVAPEPVQRGTRPRIAITQPTDAAESVTVRKIVERELKPREPKACVVCERMFLPKVQHQVCCSRDCAHEHKLELRRRKVTRIVTAACANCGEQFSYDDARVGQHTRLYCSVRCRREVWKQKRRAEAVKPAETRCAWCGGTFLPARRGNVFCSAGCRDQAAYDRRKGTRSRKHATTRPRMRAYVEHRAMTDKPNPVTMPPGSVMAQERAYNERRLRELRERRASRKAETERKSLRENG